MKSYFENALPYLEVFYQPIYNLNLTFGVEV